jgi:hypothetical protein
MTNNWHGSSVMEEFEKIAKEQGFLSSKLKENKDVVGNAKEPTPVEGHRRYEPTEEYDVTDQKCIIEQAHPEKKKELAEAQGDGGVVENIIEQQEVDIEAATNMPSGALVGAHAHLIQNLVKIANDLEDQGNYKAASKIDEVIRKLNRPFQDSQLRKEAFAWGPALGLLVGVVAPLAIDWVMGKVSKPEISGGEKTVETETTTDPKTGKETTKQISKTTPTTKKTKGIGKGGYIISAIGTGLSIIGLLGNRITSRKEGLKIDIKDLYDALQNVSKKSPSAAGALKKLQPFLSTMETLNLSEENDFKKFVTEFEKFEKITLKQIELDILKSAEIEDVSYTPYGGSERLKAKFDDVVSDVKDMNELIKKSKEVGAVLSQNIQQEMQTTEETISTLSPGVKGLQEILSYRGFLNKKWNTPLNGELDNNTITAAKELEQMIDQFIKEKNINKDSNQKVKIIKDNQINPELIPENLYRLLDLLEQNK